MEDLEDMMFLEAVRLSLVTEEERKRKAEKEEKQAEKVEKKEAKKREKEERKAAKAAARTGGPYEGSRSGHSSASGSTLSLAGLTRKRGNSAASNLRVEASVSNANAAAVNSNALPGLSASDASSRDKGKAVDRGLPATSEEPGAEPSLGAAAVASGSVPRPIPSPHQSVGPSHLRQMSSASSVSSAIGDSQPGSFSSPSHLQDPRGSGLSLGSRSGVSEDGGDQDRDKDPSASAEPMFNFRSLAEVVGVTLEGENAGRRLSRIAADQKVGEPTEHVEHAEGRPVGGAGETKKPVAVVVEQVENPSPGSPHGAQKENQHPSLGQGAIATANALPVPQVTVTPESPSPADGTACGDSKQLGKETTVDMEQQHCQMAHQVAQ